ncbi:SpaA isopeptide-forming pilin-related protein [Companilactobacillus halodurans]|uniref:LPXTG cell wall anchor domain-containing protein n=1 Tax=Companilactobacillus halodurans TaxID=2584183 RepID=A0A5P1A0F0_9LACO|nr:SpaA isopeptide-forming pilin-related protein [Companilactobacillus halodurans]MQS98502.1 LPXTG cell wall anchor domain-containing protein [Companilactobacillus halodurans]
MKMKRSLLLITILTFFLAFLFLFIPSRSVLAASSISTSASTDTASPPGTLSDNGNESVLSLAGLSAGDAKITDSNGNTVQAPGNFPTSSNYNVSYNWSIPNGVVVKAGDTASFELPDGLVASEDLSFPVYNSSSVEVGTAVIKNGEANGSITFNDALADTSASRTGTLSLATKGTVSDSTSDSENWMLNKNGWISGYGAYKFPNQITWNVAFNPNEHNLNNVVITDTLGPNQQYIPGSLTAIAGSYGPSGFVNNGQALTPTVTTSGNQITISFPGNVTTAVDIFYRVSLPSPFDKITNIRTNSATMTSNEGTNTIDASVSWYQGSSGGGGGDASGSLVTLTKVDASSGVALPGAEFELTDSTGKVLISNAETDEDGELEIYDLPDGDYTFTEVKAPDGYQLNSTPINFTISGSENSPVEKSYSQPDVSKTGAVVLKKVDPDTKDTISGATFNLLDSTGKVIKEGLVTDTSGEFDVDNLDPGEYSFVETEPASGYILNTSPIEFSIVAGQTTPVNVEKFDVAEATVSNTGDVVLTKVDSSANTPLAGAIYNLLDANGKIIESNLTTDEKGQITVPNLEAGEYSFVEVTAPSGYQLNATPISFTVVKGLSNSLNASDDKVPSAPETPENPSNPGQPSNPGTVTPNPGAPEQPNSPGVVTPNPGTPGQPNKPGTTTPSEPSLPNKPSKPNNPDTSNPSVKPNSPSTNPEKPGKPSATIPSKPEAPVFNPEESVIPGETNPITKPNIAVPENSNAINPAPSLDEALSPNNTGNSASAIPASSSDYGKGKFPQTGNKSGWILMVIGLILAIGIIIQKKRE